MQINWQEKKIISQILANRGAEKADVGSSDTPGYSLLDSSLIIRYKDNYFDKEPKKLYNCKLIKCGEYLQVYFFNIKHAKLKKGLENNLVKEKNIFRVGEKQYIEYKNILRAKFNLQRLVKANESIFKTFITLTFEKNVKDIREANKIFNNWLTNIRKRRKKDFAFVCVPEYQKRGAIHYHLMTNVDINDTSIIIPQKKRTKKTKNLKHLYDVIYWNSGFSNVFPLSEIDNVTAYITKYMTKDIDNRLFGSRKYHYSRNLNKPQEEILNISESRDFEYLKKLTNNSELVFSNNYKNSYNLENVVFQEFKLVNIIKSDVNLSNNYYL